jgi:hypothetical protein
VILFFEFEFDTLIEYKSELVEIWLAICLGIQIFTKNLSRKLFPPKNGILLLFVEVKPKNQNTLEESLISFASVLHVKN